MYGKILIVDDQESIRSLYKLFLARQKVTIIEAEDGERAISECIFHGFKFDLIIVDQSMPRLTGLDVIRLIRQRSSRDSHELPILLVSAHLDEELTRSALLHGANAVLAKPVYFQVFNDTVDRLLGVVKAP